MPFLSSRLLLCQVIQSPQSIKGKALAQEIEALEEKGAIEPAPLPSEGFYSRLFVVKKASGAWRPVIDLSPLNKYVLKSRFKMETAETALRSIRSNDWFLTFDLRDAYLQIPIQLSTAPQVFTRVMAPVSAILHQKSIRIVRYLDDWLLMADSQEESLRARAEVFDICENLGIVINPDKSVLEPKRRQYILVWKST